MTVTTLPYSSVQQRFLALHQQLKSQFDSAEERVFKLGQLGGVSEENQFGAFTPDQLKTYQQAQREHLQAHAALVGFVYNTNSELNRLITSAEANAANLQLGVAGQQAWAAKANELKQATADFNAIKANENWTNVSIVQHQIGQQRLISSAAGVTTLDSPTNVWDGLKIAIKQFIEQRNAAGAEAVLAMREAGVSVPNEYDLCVFALGKLKDSILTTVIRTPGPLGDLPSIPGDWKTMGDRVWEAGLGSTVKPEDATCKVIYNKQDLRDLLRRYGQADADMLAALDSLPDDEIGLRFDAAVVRDVAARQVAISQVEDLASMGALDAAVAAAQQQTNSHSGLLNSVRDYLKSEIEQSLDGAQIGDRTLSLGLDGLVHLNVPLGGSGAIVLASLDIGLPSGASGGLTLQAVQYGDSPPQSIDAFGLSEENQHAWGLDWEGLSDPRRAVMTDALLAAFDPSYGPAPSVSQATSIDALGNIVGHIDTLNLGEGISLASHYIGNPNLGSAQLTAVDFTTPTAGGGTQTLTSNPGGQPESLNVTTPGPHNTERQEHFTYADGEPQIQSATTNQFFYDESGDSRVETITNSDGTVRNVYNDADEQVSSTVLQTGATTLGQAVGATASFLGFLKLATTPNPPAIPLLNSGINSYIALQQLSGNKTDITLSGVGSVLSSMSSIMALDYYAKKGDGLGVAVSFTNAINYGAIGYAQLTASATGQSVTQVLTETFGPDNIFQTINTPISTPITPSLPGGTPIAYLNLVNDLAHGNVVGVALDVVAIAFPPAAPFIARSDIDTVERLKTVLLFGSSKNHSNKRPFHETQGAERPSNRQFHKFRCQVIPIMGMKRHADGYAKHPANESNWRRAA